jgi:hypothetical protein
MSIGRGLQAPCPSADHQNHRVAGPSHRGRKSDIFIVDNSMNNRRMIHIMLEHLDA